MKDTLIVNLYGGPGSGKSTGAAYIFSMLKMSGVDAEYVTEFAKDKVWEGNQEVFKCQFYITGKQAYRIARCFGKVDVIVTDSPIRLGKIYADMIGRTQLGLACIEDAEQYDDHSIDIFLRRVKPYNPNGRNQSEEEAWQLDQKIKSVIPLPYREYDGDIDGYKQIYNLIMQKMAPRLREKISE